MPWLYKQKGSENWWIGYRLNGRQYLRTTKTSDRSKAEQELAKLTMIEQAHAAGSLTDEFYRLLTKRQGSEQTLRALVKQWLAECNELSPVTLERYRSVIEEFCGHLNADDAKPLIADVRPESISAYLRQKRANTSAATAKLCRRIIVAFFNYAVENRALQISPVPSAKSLKLNKDAKSIRRAFTLAELKLLFTKAPSDFWRYMLLAGFYCGQRMGDLITLPWGAVDLEANVINMVARKTGASLHIPLRPELRTFLLKLRPVDPKPADLIWPEQARKYVEHGAGAFSNEFYDDVLLPAGLVPPRTHKAKNPDKTTDKRQGNSVSFHCLRHTFVSLLKTSGGSQAVAKELAGHSSDAVSDLYTHLPEEALSKAIAKLPRVN